jgi:hypothetical protein
MNEMENHDEVYAGVMDQCQGVTKHMCKAEIFRNGILRLLAPGLRKL